MVLCPFPGLFCSLSVVGFEPFKLINRPILGFVVPIQPGHQGFSQQFDQGLPVFDLVAAEMGVTGHTLLEAGDLIEPECLVGTIVTCVVLPLVVPATGYAGFEVVSCPDEFVELHLDLFEPLGLAL